MDASLSLLARQNDEFRKSFPVAYLNARIRGQWVVTAGIDALDPITCAQIDGAVRTFSAFTPDNDPHGEHDFGAVDYPIAGKVFWKIDYFDLGYRNHSENPSNPMRTCRVLTVMLASEY